MEIVGNVENIIFRNEDNGYSVLQVSAGKAVFTVVGIVINVSVGDRIKADVSEYNNEMYGKQYKINSYEIVIQDDVHYIEKFLTNKEFKGIGKATAKRIVEEFGEDAINVIINEPDRLIGIKGMHKARIDDIRNKLIDRYNDYNTMLKLTKYNLGPKIVKNIIDVYGDDAVKIVEENPYDMALNVDGVSFVTCDNIAKMQGLDESSQKRVEAGVLYVLELSHMDGDIFLYKDELIEKTKNILGLDGNYDFEDVFYNLTMNLNIIITKYEDRDIVFLKKVYNVEKKLSKILYSKKDNITIITGGPGTGKTYNIQKYLKVADERNEIVMLCAPTGRAAKRIKEVTNHEAKTIHRLLECVGSKDDNKIYFNKNEDNPLVCDMLIVDEMSMVDESLLYNLMKATLDNTKIIFVGDVDQLPSVGAGRVLQDMINSDLFNVIKLTTVHRQKDGSNIVVNAHKVNRGEEVDLKQKCDDFIFIHKSTEQKVNEAITTLIKTNIPNHFNIGLDQIQVICASRKCTCGVNALNNILQDAINPSMTNKVEIKVGDSVFRINDKVMQTTNNYEIMYDIQDDNGKVVDSGLGVFNGDIGEIISIDNRNRKMVVKYDNIVAYYESDAIKDLCLAYAITVHKSQGSEYDVVVMPMTTAPYQLLNRKILYTAMTRAKKCICFVGVENYFRTMLGNVNEYKRNSALMSKLYV